VRVWTGGSAGAIGIAIANPTDLIKIRMQADKAGTRYRGLMDAFRQIVKVKARSVQLLCRSSVARGPVTSILEAELACAITWGAFIVTLIIITLFVGIHVVSE